jgi:hypothetical protein
MGVAYDMEDKKEQEERALTIRSREGEHVPVYYAHNLNVWRLLDTIYIDAAAVDVMEFRRKAVESPNQIEMEARSFLRLAFSPLNIPHLYKQVKTLYDEIKPLLDKKDGNSASGS